MYKVLVSDNLAPQGIEVFKRADRIEVDVRPGLSGKELAKIIGDYDGLAVRSATKVTREILDAAKKLKVVGRAGIGVDNVDVEYATKKGVVVMNTPGGNTITTAEHTISMMLALSRFIPQADAKMKAGIWAKKEFTGREVYKKTLGIIGFGRIGRVVADRAKGLHMEVIAYDPYISPEMIEKAGVEPVDLDQLLARSDYITVHTPKTRETTSLIGETELAKAKDGVMIINCARGGIVDERALLAALESGKVAGAALDVFENEPPPPDHPLVKHPRVVCTPHLGASTGEAQVNVAVAVAEQIIDYLLKGIIRNAVNVPAVPDDQKAFLEPYFGLVERMGSFQSQLIDGAIKRVAVEYAGEICDYTTAPLQLFALKGILGTHVEDEVNLVNAPVIARERGIEVVESKSTTSGGYTSLVTMEIASAKGETLRVSGTLFRKNEPRIVQINQFPLEVTPQGCMLVMSNYDRPGVIGNIGTLLGSRGINIAQFHLGREEPGGKAMVVLTLDSPAADNVLKELGELPNIIFVKQVIL